MTPFSDGIHCYQTCSSDTASDFKCEIVEFGVKEEAPEHFRVVEEIQDIEVGGEDVVEIKFKFLTQKLENYHEEL